MLQSIVRFALGMLFTWLVAKGAVTQDQVNSDLPTIVQWVVMALLTIGSLGWTYAEKLAKGHITAAGTSIPVTPVTVSEPSAPAKSAGGANISSTALPSSIPPSDDHRRPAQ
jgi:pheromone shutdown protein TraB